MIFLSNLIFYREKEERNLSISNKTFPPPPPSVDFIPKLPRDIVRLIFSRLNLSDLKSFIKVSKHWKELATDSVVMNNAFIREFANEKLAELFEKEILNGEKPDDGYPTLPKNIGTALCGESNVFPGEKMYKTHMLVKLPKGLTLNKLGTIMKKYSYFNGYGYVAPRILSDFGDEPIKKSAWVLMAKKALESSKYKTPDERLSLIAELGKKNLCVYENPGPVELAACMFADYIRFGNIFSDVVQSNQAFPVPEVLQDFYYPCVTVAFSSRQGIELNHSILSALGTVPMQKL